MTHYLRTRHSPAIRRAGAFVLALWLAGCGVPMRPDLPTVVSIDQWNTRSGDGRLRIQYRDNKPGQLSQINCQMAQPASDRHASVTLGTIVERPRLAIDPYGTELVDFTLPFNDTKKPPGEIPYRLTCTLTFENGKQEKTRFHSTLYRIPAENGLYR